MTRADFLALIIVTVLAVAVLVCLATLPPPVARKAEPAQQTGPLEPAMDNEFFVPTCVN